MHTKGERRDAEIAPYLGAGPPHANVTLHNSTADAKVESLEVQAGDTVDFFVSLNQNLNNNDFLWNPLNKSVKTSAGLEARACNAKKDFGGTSPVPPRPLNAWEKLAQALLLSNEFVFVD